MKDTFSVKNVARLFGSKFIKYKIASIILAGLLHHPAHTDLFSGEKKFRLFDGTRPFNLYAGEKILSSHITPPTITTFTVAPSTY